MKTSDHGVAVIDGWEGFRGAVYVDVAGFPTIGYGHKLTEQEIRNRVFAAGISKEQGADLMRADLAPVEASINRSVKVELTQHQFDALATFIFNVGTGAFESSSLLKCLNSGMFSEVPIQLVRWCHRRDPKTGQMVVDQGLLKRRECEAALWNTPDDAALECPVITDEDRARVAGLVALSLAEITREDDGHRSDEVA